MICRFSPVRYWSGRIAAVLLGAAIGVLVAGQPASGAGTPVGAGAIDAHPVHVSSTQVELSADERRLEVTVRIFTDDLEDALRAIGRPVAVTTSPAADVDSALSAYLGERLQFGLDGRAAVRGRQIGHRREDDATLIFIEVPLTTVPTRVAIIQRVMMERFDDQTNLLHLRFGAKKRSALLRRGTERAEFVLPDR